MNIPTNKIVRTYLIITFTLMIPMAVLMLCLNALNCSIYGSVLGLIVLAIGGLSTAIAGGFCAKKYKKIDSYYTLFKDFFKFKQPLHYYFWLVSLLMVLFFIRIWNGQIQEGMSLIDLLFLFFVAILFGGVEEIGWRYLFGSALEHKVSFVMSTMIVAVLWGIWHILFFVVDGSILIMQLKDIVLFLISLFGTSFILSAIYKVTKSLWLCVFYHALLNALTQLFIPVSAIETIIIALVCIVISIGAVMLKESRNK